MFLCHIKMSLNVACVVMLHPNVTFFFCFLGGGGKLNVFMGQRSVFFGTPDTPLTHLDIFVDEGFLDHLIGDCQFVRVFVFVIFLFGFHDVFGVDSGAHSGFASDFRRRLGSRRRFGSFSPLPPLRLRSFVFFSSFFAFFLYFSLLLASLTGHR